MSDPADDPDLEIDIFAYDDADDPDTFCERVQLIGETLRPRDRLFNCITVGKA